MQEKATDESGSRAGRDVDPREQGNVARPTESRREPFGRCTVRTRVSRGIRLSREPCGNCKSDPNRCAARAHQPRPRPATGDKSASSVAAPTIDAVASFDQRCRPSAAAISRMLRPSPFMRRAVSSSAAVIREGLLILPLHAVSYCVRAAVAGRHLAQLHSCLDAHALTSASAASDESSAAHRLRGSVTQFASWMQCAEQ